MAPGRLLADLSCVLRSPPRRTGRADLSRSEGAVRASREDLLSGRSCPSRAVPLTIQQIQDQQRAASEQRSLPGRTV
jgi:hypothetical protein